MGKSQSQKPRQARSNDHQRAVDERRRSNAAGPHKSTRDRKTILREEREELEEFKPHRVYEDGLIPDYDDDTDFGTYISDAQGYGY